MSSEVKKGVQKVAASVGWKNVRVTLPGLPSKVYTVFNVRDSIEDYKRDFNLHKGRDPKEFKIEEVK